MASFGNSQNIYIDGSNNFSNILASVLNVVNSNNQIVSTNLNLINNEIQNNENLDSNQQSDINMLKSYFNNGLLKITNFSPSSISNYYLKTINGSVVWTTLDSGDVLISSYFDSNNKLKLINMNLVPYSQLTLNDGDIPQSKILNLTSNLLTINNNISTLQGYFDVSNKLKLTNMNLIPYSQLALNNSDIPISKINISNNSILDIMINSLSFSKITNVTGLTFSQLNINDGDIPQTKVFNLVSNLSTINMNITNNTNNIATLQSYFNNNKLPITNIEISGTSNVLAISSSGIIGWSKLLASNFTNNTIALYRLNYNNSAYGVITSDNLNNQTTSVSYRLIDDNYVNAISQSKITNLVSNLSTITTNISTNANNITSLQNYFDVTNKLKLTNMNMIPYSQLTLNDSDIPISKINISNNSILDAMINSLSFSKITNVTGLTYNQLNISDNSIPESKIINLTTDLSTLTSNLNLLQTLSGQRFNDIDTLNNTQTNNITILQSYFSNGKLNLTSQNILTDSYINSSNINTLLSYFSNGKLILSNITTTNAQDNYVLTFLNNSVQWLASSGGSSFSNPYSTNSESFEIVNNSTYAESDFILFGAYHNTNNPVVLKIGYNNLHNYSWTYNTYTNLSHYYEQLILNFANMTNPLTIQYDTYLGTTSYIISFDINYDIMTNNLSKSTINNGSFITYYQYKNLTGINDSIITYSKLNLSNNDIVLNKLYHTGASSGSVLTYDGTNIIWNQPSSITQIAASNAIGSIQQVTDGSNNLARFKIYYNAVSAVNSEIDMVNSDFTRGYYLKFISGAASANDQFAIYKCQQSAAIIDYNLTTANCMTIPSTLYAKKLILNNAAANNITITNTELILNNTLNSSNIDINYNQYITITSMGLIINGGYSASSGNGISFKPDGNWYNVNGTYQYSIYTYYAVRFAYAVDIVSSKNIKNILKNEEDLNYSDILNSFLQIKFKEYDYKYVKRHCTVGIIAEELMENKLFSKHVINCCDIYPNLKLTCKIEKIDDKTYKIITNEKINIPDQSKIKLLVNTKVIYGLYANDLIFTCDEELIDEVYIEGYEQNIPSISKTELFEYGLYILKNHILDYQTFKDKCLTYIENNTLKTATNIFDNKNLQSQINDLIKISDDNKQSIDILNSRLNLKNQSSNTSLLINTTYDDLKNDNINLKKQNEILNNKILDLNEKYNNLYIEHENIKSDLSTVIDEIKNLKILLNPEKTENIKKCGMSPSKKISYPVKK